MPDDSFLRISEVAEILRCTTQTARNKAARGIIPGAVQEAPGTIWLIPHRGIQEYISKARKNAQDNKDVVL